MINPSFHLERKSLKLMIIVFWKWDYGNLRLTHLNYENTSMIQISNTPLHSFFFSQCAYITFNINQVIFLAIIIFISRQFITSSFSTPPLNIYCKACVFSLFLNITAVCALQVNSGFIGLSLMLYITSDLYCNFCVLWRKTWIKDFLAIPTISPMQQIIYNNLQLLSSSIASRVCSTNLLRGMNNRQTTNSFSLLLLS